METQKIVNLLNGFDNENSKFGTKKMYVIGSGSKDNYLHPDPIKLLTKSIELSLFDYSDASILVTGNIAVTRTLSPNIAVNPPIPKKEKQPLNEAAQVVSKNCASFKKCSTEIDGTPKTDFFKYCNAYVQLN